MLNKRAFLVSGGSGGIGGAVCERLCELAYVPLVGFNRNESGALAIARRFGGIGNQVGPRGNRLNIASYRYPGKVSVSFGRRRVGRGSPHRGDAIQQDFGGRHVSAMGCPCSRSATVAFSAGEAEFFRKEKQGTVVGVLSEAMGAGNAQKAMPCMGAYVIGKFGLAGVLAGVVCGLSVVACKNGKTGVAPKHACWMLLTPVFWRYSAPSTLFRCPIRLLGKSFRRP